MSIRDDGRDPWSGEGQSQPDDNGQPGQYGPAGPAGGPGGGQHLPGDWGDSYRYHAMQPGAATSGAMSPDSERNWAIASHLTGFIAAYAALGFLGPLVCLLLIGERSAFARRHAVEALNFNITWLGYILVAWLLTLILVGWVLLAALGVAYLVLVIRGAMAASHGEEYRYPLTIRLVH